LVVGFSNLKLSYQYPILGFSMW